MPIQIREEDSRLYVKVLIGFSIVQVLLAMTLFVYLNASPALWGVLAAAVVLGIFLIHKFWDEKKPVRLVTRVVEYAAVLLPLLLFIVTLIMSLVEARGELHPQEWGILLFILCAIIHTFLVFMLPLMAVSATHGRRFDVVSLRVFSIAELLLALFTCFFYYEFDQNMMLVGVESVYFRAFFCLCAAVTVVASFLIRPIAWRPKWADSLVKKWNRKRTETPQPEAEQPPAADAE